MPRTDQEARQAPVFVTVTIVMEVVATYALVFLKADLASFAVLTRILMVGVQLYGVDE